ncbi:MAG: hypothetical protein J7K87_02425 [Candidatus Aenigmarchaeota archaeon]|nr:hypothetical protein [Candidatus Aenigmarchaeota archaeon]
MAKDVGLSIRIERVENFWFSDRRQPKTRVQKQALFQKRSCIPKNLENSPSFPDIFKGREDIRNIVKLKGTVGSLRVSESPGGSTIFILL